MEIGFYIAIDQRQKHALTLRLLLELDDLPPLVDYKIRIDADKVDSTKRVQDRLSRYKSMGQR